MANPDRTNKDSFLSDIELNGLRTLIRFSRENLGITRSEMSENADVNAIDIDNFINKRYKGESNTEDNYKTKCPSDVFQYRMVKYMIKIEKISKFIGVKEEKTDVERSINQLYRKYRSTDNEKYADHLFEYMSSIGVISKDGAIKISSQLAGGFYGYRLSSFKEQYLKSHFKIFPYNIYYKTPYFEHRLKEESGDIKTTRGNIFDLNNQYIFVGFVDNITNERVGIKVVIIRHEGYDRAKYFDGMYLSFDNDGSYDCGFINMERTAEKFENHKIGFFDLENLKLAKILGIDLSNIRDNWKTAIIDDKIISSINFDIISRKR